MTYRDLSDDEQVEALRPVALAAAAEFGLEVVAVELVAHAFNTTFAVEGSDGTRHALRVNTNSVSTPENVVAQQTWQHAIAAETDVLVPDPSPTPAGRWYAEVDSAAHGRPLLVTAASWLDGPDIGSIDAVTAHELGRTMALLHAQADGWSLPPGGPLPRFDTPLFGDDDLLDSATGLTPSGRAVIDEARSASAKAFADVYEDAPVRPLHADLHGGNLKWSAGRLAVFDFDDTGLGLPVVDLAVTTFYLRGGDPEPEQALRAGYRTIAPLPDVDADRFEALVTARQLLLANMMLATTTAELRRDVERYLGITVDRLSHWLETGRFTRALPGS